MKLSIMQPYFFPYIGYFQLIATSDIFVLHDDVQYIKGGWVNRNRILLNGKSRMITYPVKKGGHNLHINARSYVDGLQPCEEMINLLWQAYAKAPLYQQVFPMLRELLLYEDKNVARFNENLIRRIAGYLGLSCQIITSSSLGKLEGLTGEARVLEICRRLDATEYTNPIGGVGLYHHDTFHMNGIKLQFLEAQDARYSQTADIWIPFLSIIDVLMFNPANDIRGLLAKYRLIRQ